MNKLKSKEFVIGLSVIVGLVILFFGIDYLKGINLFKPANFYIVEYENVQGLQVAAPVTINGYKVGQVRDIKFPYDHPGKIEVLLALDKKLSVPEDTHASIVQSLLSGASLNLVLGHSNKMLPVGSHIRTTEGGGDIMAALSDDIMPQINSILPKVDSLMIHLNALVSDPALITSIRRLDGITNNVSYATLGLRNTLTSQVPGIMNNAARITYNLDTITYGLGQLSNQLRALPLEPTMENVLTVSENLKDFSAQLKNQNSTLGLLTNDPELYNRLNRVSADIDSLVLDIKRNPKRYISIKLF